jgi:hypothetical protein
MDSPDQHLNLEPLLPCLNPKVICRLLTARDDVIERVFDLDAWFAAP